MYACIFETGRGFFEGVCAPSNVTAYFYDPPPPIRESTPANASHSKENGASSMSPAPFVKLARLRHKLVYVMVEAVVNAVDVF